MANSRKVRGMATQRLLAQDCVDSGLYPWATDTGAGRSGADILNTPGASIEVKARTAFQPVAALKQATEAARVNETPVVVCRMNGQGEKSIDDWVAFCSWGEMKKLLECKKQHDATGEEVSNGR